MIKKGTNQIYSRWYIPILKTFNPANFSLVILPMFHYIMKSINIRYNTNFLRSYHYLRMLINGPDETICLSVQLFSHHYTLCKAIETFLHYFGSGYILLLSNRQNDHFHLAKSQLKRVFIWQLLLKHWLHIQSCPAWSSTCFIFMTNLFFLLYDLFFDQTLSKIVFQNLHY